MDLKQLRALIAIAECGTVTKAAEVLHVVQPALSRQIRLLEEELGVSLFDRERHGMVLTAAGRKFTERGRKALYELEMAKAELAPAKAEVSGTVVIGFLPSLGDLLVSGLMGRVRHSYPQVTLRSYVTFVQDLELALERGDIDAAMLYEREAALKFPSEPLLDESLFLVGPADAALDMSVSVGLAALGSLPLILTTAPHGLRNLVERAFTAAGITPHVTGETNSMSVQKTLIIRGLGFSILPGSAIVDDVLRGSLTAAPIAAPVLQRRITLARSPSKPPSLAVTRVLEELKSDIEQCIAREGWPGATLVK